MNDTFGINPSTGQIFLKRQVDFEGLFPDQHVIEFVVQAKDAGIQPSAMSSSTTIKITIMNVNDTIPSCYPAAVSAPVMETSNGGGSSIATLNCLDDQLLTYGIKMGNIENAFTINPSTGEVSVFDKGGGTTGERNFFNY